MTNIALVGVGYWGKNLARVFNEIGVLKSVCDLNEKNLNEIKKSYPKLKLTKNFQEILKEKDIKGVVIATPVATHHKLAKESLIYGKDVLVEKPLALNLKDGEELVKLAKERKLILMVDHLFLYHPAFIKLKSLIDKGGLGEIRHIYSTRLNFGVIRTEENALWSLASHDISMIIKIFEKLPSEVRTIGTAYINKNIPDIVSSHLKFNRNQVAEIFVSWLNPFKERKLSVIGSKKMAVFDDLSKDKLVIYHHKIEWQKGKKPKAIMSGGEIIKILEKEPLLEEAKHFLECIKKRESPKTDGKEALLVLKVLDACQKSLNQDGKQIKL
ncbi:MAG: oxidoreductase [Parcubacteria group bacterium CG08_land_8_20_14_0_20_38_56]|nr:MAG: oxidoreductase [Parcubacteria group bacterium CG08_land_8_20_14_0_20_38_56]